MICFKNKPKKNIVMFLVFHTWWDKIVDPGFFFFFFFLIKEQYQYTLLKIIVDRYKKTVYWITDKTMKHSNGTGHSLTVCTKSHMVFTLMCMVDVLPPSRPPGQKKKKQSACCKIPLHIWVIFFYAPVFWLFTLYLMPVKLNSESILKAFWSRTVSTGARLYAVTVLGPLGALPEPPCFDSEYSPINEPSSSNSPPPSA